MFIATVFVIDVQLTRAIQQIRKYNIAGSANRQQKWIKRESQSHQTWEPEFNLDTHMLEGENWHM